MASVGWDQADIELAHVNSSVAQDNSLVFFRKFSGDIKGFRKEMQTPDSMEPHQGCHRHAGYTQVRSYVY